MTCRLGTCLNNVSYSIVHKINPVVVARQSLIKKFSVSFKNGHLIKYWIPYRLLDAQSRSPRILAFWLQTRLQLYVEHRTFPC